MVSATCPHCGQALDAQAIALSHVDEPRPDGANGAGTRSLPVVPDITAGGGPADDADAETSVGGGLRRFAAVMLAVIAAVGGLAIGALLFGGGDEPVEVPDAEDGASEAIADDSSRADAEVAAVAAPTDSVAELFSSWVDIERSWAVVYPSPMGLQVMSSAGTIQPDVEVAVGFEEAARFPLMSDGSRSWAIDPTQLETAYLVSTQFVVVDVDREGRVAFINDSLDPPNIGESSFGAWGPGFDLPPDADVMAVSGRGLFVLPATGGTYEYELNGVRPFSPDVLVAASVDTEVYQRCDETLDCELYLVTPFDDDPRLLDIDVQSRLWPSPGGRWLVVRSPDGTSWVRDVIAGTALLLDGDVTAVDWAEDASLVALLTRDELVLLRPDTGDLRSVTLPVAPSAPEVLLVSE